MKRVLAFTLLALVCTTSIPSYGESAGAPSASSSGSAVDEARDHFQRGVQFYSDRDFDAALAEFSRAYQLVPNYRVLYNLAQVEVERRDYAAAMKLYRQYLDEGQAEVPSQRREQVERDLASLKSKTAELRVKSEPAGAEVVLNGVVVGKTPMADSALVNAGVLQLSVRKPGFAAEGRTITATGGERQEIEVKLKTEAAAAPVTAANVETPITPQKEANPPNRTPFWIALTSTSVLAVGAGTFAIVTQHANSRLDEQLETYPTNRNSLDETRSQVKRDALITDILTGGAIVGAITTVYFALSGPSAEKPTAARLGLQPLSVGSGLSLVGEL